MPKHQCHDLFELASLVVVHVDVAHGPGQDEAGSLRLRDLKQPLKHLPLHDRNVVLPPLHFAPLVGLKERVKCVVNAIMSNSVILLFNILKIHFHKHIDG